MAESSLSRPLMPPRSLAGLSVPSVGLSMLAFGAAIYAPALLFFALPLLFGVPHIASDVRHLVLRRELPAAWRRTIWMGCAVLLGLRALDAVYPLAEPARIETLIAAAWASVAIRESGGHGPTYRVGVALGVVLLASGAALMYPRGARLALLHAHNLVALLAAVALFRAGSRPFFLVGMLVLGAAALLASGAFFRPSVEAASALLGTRWFGMHVLEISDQVAPGLRSDYAVGITSAFLFLQAVHYVIWLAVIPQQERAATTLGAERERSPGAGQGSNAWLLRVVHAWRVDFGTPGLLLIAGASVALLASGLVQLRASRSLYLSLATFHVYLELVMLTYFWVAGGRGMPSPSRIPAAAT